MMHILPYKQYPFVFSRIFSTPIQKDGTIYVKNKLVKNLGFDYLELKIESAHLRLESDTKFGPIWAQRNIKDFIHFGYTTKYISKTITGYNRDFKEKLDENSFYTMFGLKEDDFLFDIVLHSQRLGLLLLGFIVPEKKTGLQSFSLEPLLGAKKISN